MRKGLFDSLKEYSESEAYPFHMPGHKRNPESGVLNELYAYDITEIDGFDNLHQPKGLIKEAQIRAAQLYGAKKTYFLVNGSTAGILSAVSAIAEKADKLIIARNCHKAVYNAAFLNRMELHYVYPEVLPDYNIAGGIKATEIEKKIKEILSQEKISKIGKLSKQEANQVIAGVVITSPTYDGISSNIKEIADLVHRYGLPLIVDQAHGAHFGLHSAWPENAVNQGADVVIHSVHKTLAAPTQTALLHQNGQIVNQDKLRRYLSIYQSSSPSYLLMAGIDEAVRIAKEEGRSRLDELLTMRHKLLVDLEACRHIRVCPDTEPGKLIIGLQNAEMTGQQLYTMLLEKYHLQMEMAAGSYVVAIVTMMDTEEGFTRLSKALLEIDQDLQRKQLKLQSVPSKENRLENGESLPIWQLQTEVVLPLWEATNASCEEVDLADAEGKIAAEYINLYPPGIPIVVPGERMEKGVIGVIQSYLGKGYVVQGVEHNQIKVVSHV